MTRSTGEGGSVGSPSGLETPSAAELLAAVHALPRFDHMIRGGCDCCGSAYSAMEQDRLGGWLNYDEVIRLVERSADRTRGSSGI